MRLREPYPHHRALAYGIALAASVAALAITALVPELTNTPYVLCYFAVAAAAWTEELGAAMLATALTCTGLYSLVLVPRDPHALLSTAAFGIVAVLISLMVSQRSRAMKALRASEMHHRSIANTASEVILTIDADSRILSINPAVRSMFGYDPEELIGSELITLMPERYRDAHLAGIARHMETGSRHMEWTGVQLPGLRKDGEELPLEISFGSYTLDGQAYFTGFIRDITERQKSHTALIQSEKLAAVGRLASSIAHEINNPLDAVMNLVYLAQSTNDVGEVRKYLSTADRELQRLSVISNQTLQFHKRFDAPAHVLCEDLVRGPVALSRGRIANTNIDVLQRHRACAEVVCVEGEMRQVLNNLIGNAMDALARKAAACSSAAATP